MSTSLVSPTVAKARALACPHCGGPVELRGFAHTLNVVCPQCLSVLDASTPEFQILQTFQARERIQPLIPLGSRGALRGATYEVIGFQVRQAGPDEDPFSWNEYLLFNPYHGFRYLTGYEGHWNFVRVMSALPEAARSGGKLAVRFDGRTYVHFDSGKAATSYVLGEFPWQVRVGDSAVYNDYVSPPWMLSSEATDDEVTWSRAEYVPGAALWQAFRLPGSPPLASGIFANQPSPYAGKVASAWRLWLWLTIALFAIMLFFTLSRTNREVFSQSYTFVPGRSEAAFVTPTFELAGRDSNVALNIHTDVYNDWIYFNFALINEETGQAFDFGREVSYYRDSDGSEGSPNNDVVVPDVPAGRYYLRVEPEMSATAPLTRYQLAVRRDVPTFGLFWLAAGLLLIPPIFKTVRSAGFEARRWRESDYAPSMSSSSDDAGGDD